MVAAVIAATGLVWRARSQKLTLAARVPQTTASLTTTGESRRPVYRHSVLPGGVRSPEELRNRLAADDVARAHYRRIPVAELQPVNLEQAKSAYVSYRRDERIYWTASKVPLQQGELVLTNGKDTVRGRCGNQVSDVPQTPVAKSDPPVSDFEIPDFPPIPGQLILPELTWPGPPGHQLGSLPLVASASIPVEQKAGAGFVPVIGGGGFGAGAVSGSSGGSAGSAGGAALGGGLVSGGGDGESGGDSGGGSSGGSAGGSGGDGGAGGGTGEGGGNPAPGPGGTPGGSGGGGGPLVTPGPGPNPNPNPDPGPNPSPRPAPGLLLPPVGGGNPEDDTPPGPGLPPGGPPPPGGLPPGDPGTPEAETPEPSTLGLIGVSLGILIATRRRNR